MFDSPVAITSGLRHTLPKPGYIPKSIFPVGASTRAGISNMTKEMVYIYLNMGIVPRQSFHPQSLRNTIAMPSKQMKSSTITSIYLHRVIIFLTPTSTPEIGLIDLENPFYLLSFISCFEEPCVVRSVNCKYAFFSAIAGSPS
jgi:hypothetical protein